MPFTPTHALAAVPLARLRVLVPSALAIGAMAPDLPMFLRGTPSYPTTHAWLWGPVSCLPYGMIAFALFRLCRGPAIAFAPESARRRLAPYAATDLDMGASAWAAVVVSIVLGVWTHIVWDGFTHAHRFGSELIPELTTTWLTLWGEPVPGYKALQYGSSVIGLPILVRVIARWYARQPETGSPAIPAASGAQRLLALALLFGAPPVAAAFGWARFARSGFAELFAYHAVTHTIGAYLFGVVALTLPQQLRAVIRPTASSRRD